MLWDESTSAKPGPHYSKFSLTHRSLCYHQNELLICQHRLGLLGILQTLQRLDSNRQHRGHFPGGAQPPQRPIRQPITLLCLLQANPEVGTRGEDTRQMRSRIPGCLDPPRTLNPNQRGFPASSPHSWSKVSISHTGAMAARKLGVIHPRAPHT